MTDTKSSGTWSDTGLSIFNTLWNWTGTSETWRVVLVGFVLVVLLLWVLASCLTAFTKLLDGGVKLIDSLKASGLPRFMKREDRIKVRRRSQFCAVLEADLTNIAKAESWNDQYFTDLEAEVETDGGYYISPIHRLFGKVSTGLRKEKSLIKAITSSSERAIQLTGEPGSGKSVALRHLASQLAMRGKTSKAKDVLVPLYINLREIDIPANSAITADTVRDFILDNIRRGDSDTTAYVRENWADYRERGIWFFLFDSFDEIPAVLHAEKGNPAIKEYAEAIRMFLEGMGSCRGILASREFKGPESLPWKKFRILRLSSKKQRELVTNAFLSQAQERTVLHHLAANKSTLANTPLFLTLLCRYVKESSTAPTNDYELLSLQIDRLAQRDPTYLKRTYALSPSELLHGAQRIARLFAEDPSLGLAPTLDQVEAVLGRQDLPGGNIQRFVAAMVDSKIARADVANAAPGDRRFAFAHRRYQEALFVRHLVTHPAYLSGYDLLTDPRWREYAVTLLETQPAEALNEMLETAAELLREATKSQRRRKALDPLNSHCGYFDWTHEATQMLSLLQEGLARRVSAIPVALSSQVEQFLKVRWETGDSFDRLQVIRNAALLPQATLARYLEEIFLAGSDKAQNEGFNQTASLIGQIPVAVRQAVLKRLSDEILSAKDASALMRVEALVARLPRELGAEYVQRRSLMLWRLTKVISTALSLTWPTALIGRLRAVFDPQGNGKNAAARRTQAALLIGAMSIVYLLPVTTMVMLGPRAMHELAAAMDTGGTRGLLDWWGAKSLGQQTILVSCALATLVYTTFPVLFRFRATGEPLNVGFFMRRMNQRRAFFEPVATVAIGFLGVSVLGAIAYFIGLGLATAANLMFGLVIAAPKVFLGIGALFFASAISFLLAALFTARWKRISLAVFRDRMLDTPSAHLPAVLSAQNWKQFEYWLSLWEAYVRGAEPNVSVEEQMRSLSSALQHLQRGGSLPVSVAAFTSVEPNKLILARCINSVEKMNLRMTPEHSMDVTAPNHATIIQRSAVA
jgi:hypothetical protein